MRSLWSSRPKDALVDASEVEGSSNSYDYDKVKSRIGNMFYVYILGNYLNTVLYTGITNNLCKRVWEHKQELVSGFTKKYHIHTLLYYEQYSDPLSAIKREKQIKGWNRKKKNMLILKMNPHLVDLSPILCE